MKTALLIGGTAATGRAIIGELRQRGYRVTLYNRGRFNAGLKGDDIEFIVGDPHFRQSIAQDLGERRWDIVVATYGRTRLLAEALADRCGQFIGVSGTPVCRTDLGSPTRETDPVVDAVNGPAGMTGIIPRIAETEQRILEIGDSGSFAATIVRYPYVYGPYSLVPMEWHVIKRAKDSRTRWALPDGGLFMTGRCASANAAALIGAMIDAPDRAGGNIYHAADRRQFTQREWITAVAEMVGHRFDFVDIPPSIAPLGYSSVPMSGEMLFSHSKESLQSGRLQHNFPSPVRAEIELGYREKVAPLDWMQKTVDYWLANPFTVSEEPGSPLSPLDFDYAAEDQLLAWWDRVVDQRPNIGEIVARGHPYDHPKAK